MREPGRRRRLLTACWRGECLRQHHDVVVAPSPSLLSEAPVAADAGSACLGGLGALGVGGGEEKR